MEAPEKLYIALNELDEDERTFVLKHRVDYPICTEYTRANAFIEKACEFIETYPHLFMGVLRSEVIEDFKNYMKGE